MTWLRRALGLSRVTKIGGLGLFFDPGGRPLGLRLPTSTAPSLASSPVSLSSSSSSLPPLLLLVSLMESSRLIFPNEGELDEESRPGRPT